MMSSPTPPADEIQRQMRRVRAELGDDVQDLVASAQVMADWHSYVRAYPWLCVGAAAVAGYLIVPARTRFAQPDAATLQKLVENVGAAGVAASRPTLASMVMKMALSSLLQGGLGILSKQLQRQLQQHQPSAPTHEEQHHD
jgi:hypothetical protein